MEKNFYHPERGYWQTLSEPSEKTVSSYPLGTVEVAIRPSQDHQYIKGSWVYVEPEAVPYVASDLSPRRFKYLLAYTGLDDVWSALEAELKDTDRAAFAQIKAQRSALSFSQAKTIGLVEMFADTAKRVVPNADLSSDAIKVAWIVAEQANL